MPFHSFGRAPAPWVSTSTARHRSAQPPKCFFYGSLMDPDVLRTISRTEQEPKLVKASIQGFKMKMWGPYPTLVPGNHSERVDGMLWEANDHRQLQYLQDYETENYKSVSCKIRVQEGEGTGSYEDGVVFVWAGDRGELMDGKFSLEHYQLYNKSRHFRRE